MSRIAARKWHGSREGLFRLVKAVRDNCPTLTANRETNTKPVRTGNCQCEGHKMLRDQSVLDNLVFVHDLVAKHVLTDSDDPARPDTA